MTKTEAGRIQIVVNGESRAVPDGMTLLQLIQMLGLDPAKIALEKDCAIIRKADWPLTLIEAGAQLEIVQFVGGG